MSRGRASGSSRPRPGTCRRRPAPSRPSRSCGPRFGRPWRSCRTSCGRRRTFEAAEQIERDHAGLRDVGLEDVAHLGTRPGPTPPPGPRLPRASVMRLASMSMPTPLAPNAWRRQSRCGRPHSPGRTPRRRAPPWPATASVRPRPEAWPRRGPADLVLLRPSGGGPKPAVRAGRRPPECDPMLSRIEEVQRTVAPEVQTGR